MRTSHRVLAPIAGMLFLAGVPISPAHAEETISDAAPVLGRILEKNLEEEGIEMPVLQWAYVEGRGLLYAGGVSVGRLGSALEPADKKAMDEEELLWRNTRREIQGKPPLRSDEGERASKAIAAVTQTLERFSDRVPLREGEKVRVGLYSRHDRSCATCHASSMGKSGVTYRRFSPADLSDVDGDGFADGGVRVEIEKIPGHRWAFGTPMFGPHRALGIRNLSEAAPPLDAVAIDRTGALPGSAERQEDAAVLARVLGKKLESEFPQEFWGVDMKGRPGAVGMSAGGWGVAVFLNMTFPLDEERDVRAEELDLWERTERELRGAPLPEKTAAGKRATKVEGEKLLRVLKEALADFGGRIRGLAEGEEIVVAVFGGESGGKALHFSIRPNADDFGAPDQETESQSRYLVLKSLESSKELHEYLGKQRRSKGPTYLLRLAAGDILRAKRGELSRAELLERVRVE